ncbi:complex I subunit 5 family protein [Fusibacter ferrireducens]|uniref:Monovalent cation/H+ antiporter subunit D family protein n=1 Tax=Fusibacter ferrireducens TaxID=2785058 RepID=A0ABR9ZVF1_9FIRM|nr:proton-conducting transporter membrane subunit [Fusibacter ferrireducens]MBF4694403.1 monovalent cation/H+ antiporter subunit D family protein [Fusibacter ferrireducens]
MEKIIMLLPLGVPIVGTLLIADKKIIKDEYVTKFVSIVLFANFLLVLTSLFGNPLLQLHVLGVNDFLDVYFKIDQMTRVFALMASILWILTAFYAFEYMKHEQRTRQFYTFFTLTLAVILGVAYSGNLFTLYAYYELLTLCTLPLVIHTGTEEALSSGKKYMIYSFAGASLVILGMMILYSITGTMTFMPRGIFNDLSNYDQDLIRFSYIAMFLGFGVKAALVPFHSWLPNAMVAPTPVSALLHAVAVVKSGVFSLIRITYFVFGASVIKAVNVTQYLIPFVVITVVMGSLLALHQDHLKKRLAYSTISQLGYILLGILMLNPNGLVGAILHMINHAVIKITLFFSVGAISHMTHKKYIHQISGLGKKMPITFICFTIASVSLVGIPPTNGFVSKWFLGVGALNADNLFYIFILLLSAFFTAGYLFPISVTAFFVNGKQNAKQQNAKAHEIVVEASLEKEAIETSDHSEQMDHTGASIASETLDPSPFMLVPIVILTVIIVGLGIFPNVVINFLGGVIADAF